MEEQELIIVEVFCRETQIDVELIDDLESFGLIEVIQNNGLKYIDSNHLPHIQKIIEFHNELNINKEGIEVVLNLLDQIAFRDDKIRYLQARLKLYE